MILTSVVWNSPVGPHILNNVFKIFNILFVLENAVLNNNGLTGELRNSCLKYLILNNVVDSFKPYIN